jgi:hypothetical protein
MNYFLLQRHFEKFLKINKKRTYSNLHVFVSKFKIAGFIM